MDDKLDVINSEEEIKDATKQMLTNNKGEDDDE